MTQSSLASAPAPAPPLLRRRTGRARAPQQPARPPSRILFNIGSRAAPRRQIELVRLRQQLHRPRKRCKQRTLKRANNSQRSQKLIATAHAAGQLGRCACALYSSTRCRSSPVTMAASKNGCPTKPQPASTAPVQALRPQPPPATAAAPLALHRVVIDEHKRIQPKGQFLASSRIDSAFSFQLIFSATKLSRPAPGRPRAP